MCEVNVAKFNPKPHFGNIKVGDMFQDNGNYWYMKGRSKDGKTFAISLEDGVLYDDFCDNDEIQTFFTPSAITVQ